MSDKKMSPELQTAIRRSPEYTAPSAEVADLQVRLEAANKVALTAMERAKKLQAEVDRVQPEFDAIIAANEELRAEIAGWRQAVRWRRATDWELRVGVRGTIQTIGVVKLRPDGWMAMTDAVDPEFGLSDRNAACTKVCELLGLPEVLP